MDSKRKILAPSKLPTTKSPFYDGVIWRASSLISITINKINQCQVDMDSKR